MPNGVVTPAGRTSHDDVLLAGLSLKTSNLNLPPAYAAGALLTSQTIYACAVPYRAGDLVTNIVWFTDTAGVGVVPAHIYTGLCSATTMLRGSANVNAGAGWTVAVGLHAFALTSPYQITSDGLYYHLILEDGAFATTPMKLARGPGSAGIAQVDAAGTFFYATAGTAQTALPADNAAVTLAAAGAQSFLTFSS